jgi:hypothetical protein
LADGVGGGAQADARAANSAVAATIAKDVRRSGRELLRLGPGNFKHNLEFQQ